MAVSYRETTIIGPITRVMEICNPALPWADALKLAERGGDFRVEHLDLYGYDDKKRVSSGEFGAHKIKTLALGEVAGLWFQP